MVTYVHGRDDTGMVMAILIEEGLNPNGTDLVVGEPSKVTRYESKKFATRLYLDGIEVRLLIRVIKNDHRIHAVRSLELLDADGTRLPRAITNYIDDMELVGG